MAGFRALALVLVVAVARPAGAAPAGAADAYFYSSDGVRLHYTVAGPADGRTIVFVPGWTMPGWIFAPQISYFSRAGYRVIAFDPRGQGESEIAADGYDQSRRGEDIADLLGRLGTRPLVIVGWSLGVLDTLAYVHMFGDARVAGLVLIDNSVGENPPPLPYRGPAGPALSHAAYMRAFVAQMFRTYQSPAYLARLTAATLVTPVPDAAALLRYPVPRRYWRAAIFSTDKPVLYVVRPGLRGQAENLLRDRANTSVAIYGDAGHALFVDDAARFDAQMAGFLDGRVWPR